MSLLNSVKAAAHAYLRPVQGWSAFSPHFNAVDFVSLYIEIPLMIVALLAWYLFRELPRLRAVSRAKDREADVSAPPPPRANLASSSFEDEKSLPERAEPVQTESRWSDLADLRTLDLYADEYALGSLTREQAEDEVEAEKAEERRQRRQKAGPWWRRYAWRVFYVVA